ncbi:MAG: V-type ATP synthase subunit E [Verrucomicrobia bacterium]|nr:V-type ATP synthase subunit E [Verrucomicrobiota bacterium]
MRYFSNVDLIKGRAKPWSVIGPMETGKDKVKKICDVLRRETLEPAKKQAEETISTARQDAERMIEEARLTIQRMEYEAKQEIERQKTVFQSSLSQACKQAVEALRQSIEDKLFNPELMRLISEQTQDPQLLAQLVKAVVSAVEKEGLEANLTVYIPAAVPAKSINALLGAEILERLKEKSVLIGPLTGGIEVKLHKENITVDISDAALKEIIAAYIRKDFRELFFGKN